MRGIKNVVTFGVYNVIFGWSFVAVDERKAENVETSSQFGAKVVASSERNKEKKKKKERK